MQWGTLVWFSDHPRPFLVRDAYCSDAECTCNQVGLTLQEISDRGEEVPNALSLHLSVDLTTWTESDPPQRPLKSADWVREFLSTFPEDRRAELKARFANAKRRARHLADYTIAVDEVTKGTLFPYGDLLDDEKCLTTGGNKYTYRFVHQDSQYLVEDLYCPKPSCDCREFYVQFWIESEGERNGVEAIIITQSVLGNVKFTGQQKVVQPGELLPNDAKALLSAWWDNYSDDLPMFKRRYDEVKQIGQRSLDADVKSRRIQPLDAVQPAALAKTPLVLELPPSEVLSDRRRIGRNDVCLCGSGLKYKKCCGRHV